MIYNYEECIKIYGNHYNLVKALEEGKLYKIENGIYSSTKNPRDIEIFIKKHKDAVFTLQSALYYYGISDEIPEDYVVATDKDATKYKEKNVKQYFINNNLIGIGAINIDYGGVTIPVYDKERLLIEVIKYKNKLPFDYYKEVINYYRNHINELNIPLLMDYLDSFPKNKLITHIIQLEVL